MPTRRVAYEHDGAALEGVLAVESDGPRPTVLVCHGMEGRSEAQVDFARSLAGWGYAGFAADLFGPLPSPDRGGELMAAYMADRAALRERLLRVLSVARSLPEVDETRVAAIGFCFGGLCVLDLARGGADVRGVASFHGVLTPPPVTASITAKVIVFHGWDDPYAPPEDVTALGRELTGAGADWQIHAYGNTMHSFMATTADNPAGGVQYNEVSARRAWNSLRTFLAESFA